MVHNRLHISFARKLISGMKKEFLENSECGLG